VPRFHIPLGRREFAPGLVPTLLMLPVLALLLWLGTWQLHRAAEKQALWDGFARGTDVTVDLPAAPPSAALPARYSHVRVAGTYLPDRQILLDNMTIEERGAGYRVLTPLVCADGTVVLVDRGWVPLGRTRADLPDVRVGMESRVVTGRVDTLPRPGIEPVAPPDGAGWPRVLGFPTMPQVERVLGRPVYPLIVLLDPALPDGFVRAWQPPGFPPERHVGYAVQWYALALTLVLIWFFVNLRKRTESR
jgi:surfeit locus 1 family protein